VYILINKITLIIYFYFLIINNSFNCLNKTYKVSNDAEKQNIYIKKKEKAIL